MLRWPKEKLVAIAKRREKVRKMFYGTDTTPAMKPAAISRKLGVSQGVIHADLRQIRKAVGPEGNPRDPHCVITFGGFHPPK